MVTGRCNKCRGSTELVFADVVCERCSDGLDKLWGECTSPDWVLTGVPARSWGSPLPGVGHFLHRNTSYAEMKSKWALWPNPCEIRPATQDEIAAEEERSREEAARRQATIDQERAKSQREPFSPVGRHGRAASQQEQVSPVVPQEAAKAGRAQPIGEHHGEAAPRNRPIKSASEVGKFITQTVAFIAAAAACVGIPLALLYLLVRFVKWAWSN